MKTLQGQEGRSRARSSMLRLHSGVGGMALRGYLRRNQAVRHGAQVRHLVQLGHEMIVDKLPAAARV
jgi:hypothetical protein